MTSQGHIVQDDHCWTLSTKKKVLNDMANADLRQKIISLKEYDEEENEIFYITLDLCIDEGNNDVQLWERYRPDHKVKKLAIRRFVLIYSIIVIGFRCCNLMTKFNFQVLKETGLGGYQLRLISNKELCVDTSEIENIGVLVSKKCDVKSKFQRFHFEYQFVKA